MKTKLSSIIVSVLLIIGFVNCTNSNKTIDKENIATTHKADLSEIQVLYFHGTNRCATCNAVETVTRIALKDFYEDKVEFKSINRELEINKKLVRKYKIINSTLIVVHNDKVENITNYAFMNARSNPDKLKQKIKETIDAIIK